MRAASREASALLRPAKREVILAMTSVPELQKLAAELYEVANVLVDEPRLRRVVGNPASDPAGREQFVRGLFGGKVIAGTLDIAAAAARQRWSSPWDLTDALEIAGDDALFQAAHVDGATSRVVDELFRFERVLDANSELTTLLDQAPIVRGRRLTLLNEILADRVHPVTKSLLEHAVLSQRKRSLTLAIDDLLDEAARREDESMARVISAVDLTQEQCQRLATALGHIYGRGISVRTAVAPAVRGGLIIRIGDEVIDGSVASRLISARAGLADTAMRADITTRTRHGKQD